MFDFLRNLTKSAEEKRQETMAAYVDGVLDGRSRQQFEQELAQDDALRLEVEQLQLIKQSLRQLPQREVPRNFILNPAEFRQRPAPQPWVTAYPVLRTATALAAFFFIFAVVAGAFTGFGVGDAELSAPAADVAEVEVTRVVTELVTEEGEAQSAAVAEDAGDETIADGALVEEAAADEEAADSALGAEVETFEEVAEEALEEEESPAKATSVASTAVAETTNAIQDDAEDAPQPAGTPLVAPTPTAQPTATVSTLPRITPPTPLPDRDPEIGRDEADEDEADGVAEAPEEEEMAEDADTAVSPESTERDTTLAPPTNLLLWLQIGLGLSLLLLLGLTFYARRQR